MTVPPDQRNLESVVILYTRKIRVHIYVGACEVLHLTLTAFL